MGTQILAAPWAGRTRLWCFRILASAWHEIKGVGAATAVGLMGGWGSWGCWGSLGSRRVIALAWQLFLKSAFPAATPARLAAP